VPVLASAIVWISALWSTTLLLAAPCSYDRPILAALYLLLGLHLAWITRQLGSYRLLTSLLYPLPLAYHCFVFGRSAARHALRRKTLWRGREV
jgi:4,4'-diaponeurosporenoate glycosyltransferase